MGPIEYRDYEYKDKKEPKTLVYAIEGYAFSFGISMLIVIILAILLVFISKLVVPEAQASESIMVHSDTEVYRIYKNSVDDSYILPNNERVDSVTVDSMEDNEVKDLEDSEVLRKKEDGVFSIEW